MANIVIIEQDLALKTTEFRREDGSGGVHHKKNFGSSFEIDWDPDLDPRTFTVFSSEQNFVIGYHEIDQGTYPTPLDYYDYLKSLSRYDLGGGGGGGGDATAANQLLQIAELQTIIQRLEKPIALNPVPVNSDFPYAPAAPNTKQVILAADPSELRHNIYISVEGDPLWISLGPIGIDPTARQGTKVSKGDVFRVTPNDGHMHYGEICAINATDGGTSQIYLTIQSRQP